MRRRLVAVVVLMGALGTALTACSADDDPGPVTSAFLAGWATANFDGVQFVSPNGSPISSTDVAAAMKELAGNLLPSAVTAKPAGEPSVTGDDATVRVDVDWPVGGATWEYQTTVQLHRKDGVWRVVWNPATVHPELKEGDRLAAQRLSAERGLILDGAGEAIVRPRPVVVVGIEPRRIRNQAAELAELDAALRSVGVPDPIEGLTERIAAAKEDAFVEVITLRREVYDTIRSRIRELPGTVFREETLHLAPTRSFARALLGTVGPVQKDQMDANPGKYVVGDQVGHGGLQERYDDYLRGKPGVRILVTGRGEGNDVELWRADPVAGRSLRTTVDQRVQQAAETALAEEMKRSALVAIRVSDGALLAVANGPDGGSVNLAFTASVPPGSTFKMITSLALLDAGKVTPDSPVACPTTYTVDGRTFRNSFSSGLGTVPFRVNFARSCNTAFASLAPQLGTDGLKRAAASVGIGTEWDLGDEVFTGSVEANAPPVEAAAAAFGQGRTLVSPVAMAAATAAVARGSWRQPVLFTERPDGKTVAGGETPLKPESVAHLRTMMRDVVTSGTATALAGVPGGPVYAKTGTAEYDNDPSHAHAWVVGWQGDIAFAVFVEQGGSSSATAVPIARSFLAALNRS